MIQRQTEFKLSFLDFKFTTKIGLEIAFHSYFESYFDNINNVIDTLIK